jgi:Ala-tRNA(Pro) deacylase
MNEDVLILETLNQLNISYTRITHEPAFTIDDIKHLGEFDGNVCKNLFLYDKRADRHYLVTMLQDKKAHFNTIRKRLKAASLVFGTEDKLLELLGVTPGSVSPLGIVHAQNKSLTLLLDEDLPKQSKLGFHPNINTSTFIISYADFEKYIIHCDIPYEFIGVTKDSDL